MLHKKETKFLQFIFKKHINYQIFLKTAAQKFLSGNFLAQISPKAYRILGRKKMVRSEGRSTLFKLGGLVGGD